MSVDLKSKTKRFLASNTVGRTLLSYKLPKDERRHFLTALSLSRQTIKTIESQGRFGVGENNLNGQSGYEYFSGNIAGLFERTLFLYLKNGGDVPNLLNPQKFSDFLFLYVFFGRIPSPSPEDKVENESYIPEDLLPLVTKHQRPFISQESEAPGNDVIEPGIYMWKANHGWGLHHKVTYPIDEVTRNLMTEMAGKWLEEPGNEARGIWWNGFVERKVYLERHLGGEKEVNDWKIFVLGGRVEIVQVDVGRFSDHRQNIYDRNFTSLQDELYFQRGEETEKPDRFDDMVKVAEGIGRNFEFIRVDFYCVDGKIYLGEIGIAPNAARLPIISDALDKRLGAAWPEGGVLRDKRI